MCNPVVISSRLSMEIDMYGKYFISLVLLQCMCSSILAETIPASNKESNPTELKDTYIQQLIAKTKCQPSNGKQCEVTTNQFSDTLDFLRYCNELKGWVLNFQYKPTLKFVFNSDTTDCKFTATSTF